MNLPAVALGVYALLFAGFAFAVSRQLRFHGRVLLDDAFGAGSAVARSVAFLLDLGFSLLCLGLLLWNLGSPPSGGKRIPDPDNEGNWIDVFSAPDIFTSVALRLGISIFVVAVFHSINILVVSVLSRKRT